jgi:uncharacterized membrane protein
MRWLSKSVFTVMLGLILAVCIHLVAILAMPSLGERSAYFRIAGTHATNDTAILALPALTSQLPPYADPAVAMSACTFDLSEGPLRVAAPVANMPMSLSVHDMKGGVFYAVPDRAAARGQIAVVLMTRRQLDEAISRDDEDEPARDLRVPLPITRGIVVLRALGMFPSQKAVSEIAVTNLSCNTEAT